MSTRYAIATFFLLAALVVFGFGYNAFRTEASAPLSTSQGAGVSPGQAVARETEAAVAAAQREPQRFAVVYEKNLFSPKREAWNAPPPPAPEETVEEEPEEIVEPPLVVLKDAIVLEGTFITKRGRRALLEFKSLQLLRPRQILSEGDTVQDVRANIESSFTLERVERDRVIVRDEKERRYLVEKPFSRAASGSSGSSGTKITVDSGAAPKSVSVGQPGGGGSSGGSRKAGDISGMSLSDISRLPTAEKQRLAKDGKLQVQKTPFGPKYVLPENN